jgi:actin-related protein
MIPSSSQLVVRVFIPNRSQSHSFSAVAKSKNIPTLLSESLHACHPDLQQVLMGNVVLTGGGSLLPGPADRLETELSRNFPHVSEMCIIFDCVFIAAGQGISQ